MKTAKDLLSKKGNEVYSVKPDDTVYRAIEIMADKGCGALMVMDGDKPAGIFSERDYTRKVVLKKRASKDTPVKDIMTSKVIYAEPSHTIEQCMAVMTEKHFRHMPVMEEGKVLGMISLGDLVKALIAEQQIRIEQLERYITG